VLIDRRDLVRHFVHGFFFPRLWSFIWILKKKKLSENKTGGQVCNGSAMSDEITSVIADELTFKYLANEGVVDVSGMTTTAPEKDEPTSMQSFFGTPAPLASVHEDDDEDDEPRVQEVAQETPEVSDDEGERRPREGERRPREDERRPREDERRPREDELPDDDHHDLRHDDDRRPSYEPFEQEEDEELAKRTVLIDLARLEKQGVVMTKRWTMHDRYSDMLLELRRHLMLEEEQSNVDMLKDGLKMLVTGVEVLSKKFQVLDLDGWSSEVSGTLSKHDATLARIYRKHWRRGSSRNPEVELALALIGSAGMYHLKSSMSKHLVYGNVSKTTRRASRKKPVEDSSSDEEAPQ
jgi:hypothetical protein